MPRINPRLVRQAHALHHLLPRLLPTCRDLHSAQNELRWLREHVERIISPGASRRSKSSLLYSHVRRRARGEPLQYILASEFFGDLEIKCAPGVLIPRQETAASVSHLVRSLSFAKEFIKSPLRVLDLCTGTGCIPLLFHHEFYSKPENDATGLCLAGVDISSSALRLARENHLIQLESQTSAPALPQHRSLRDIRLLSADILRSTPSSQPSDPPSLVEALSSCSTPPDFDILISNPPYVSSKSYIHTTSPSVRRYEPKLALVPRGPQPPTTHDGDLFYPHLLRIADKVHAKVLLFEVADMEQATRVAGLVLERDWEAVEIWRDGLAKGAEGAQDEVVSGGHKVKVRGKGEGRSVVAFRKEGLRWSGRGRMKA